MKARVLVGVLVLVVAGVSARGQAAPDLRLAFRYSSVVLTSGDTLSGPVVVNLTLGLLHLVQPDGSPRTFAPANVAAFAVQGEILPAGAAFTNAPHPPDPSLVRLFRTFTWQPNGPGQRPETTFFEQLSSGPVLLVRRQRLVLRPVALPMNGLVRTPGATDASTILGARGGGRGQQPPVPIAARYATAAIVEDLFYLAWSLGEVRPLRPGKKDLLAAFPAQARQLQAHAHANHLGYATAGELSDLVNYANSMGLTAKP